jgi:hypothetical protein
MTDQAPTTNRSPPSCGSVKGAFLFLRHAFGSASSKRCADDRPAKLHEMQESGGPVRKARLSPPLPESESGDNLPQGSERLHNTCPQASACVVGASTCTLMVLWGILQILSGDAEPPHAPLRPGITPDLATQMEGVVDDAQLILRKGMKGLRQVEMDLEEAERHIRRLAKQVESATAAGELVSPASGFVMPGLENGVPGTPTESAASSLLKDEE